jgi:polar amino acid transport system permease protein
MISVGKTAEKSFRVTELLKFMATASLLIVALVISSKNLDYNWQWYRVGRYLIDSTNGALTAGPLLIGLTITLKITALSLVLSSMIGLGAALCRMSSLFSARLVARCYLELIRNTPLLVQLFFIYFVVSPVIGISRFAAAVLALSLFEGAYASEIFRAGILSVDKGQWEAAFSIGLDKYQAYRRVILPQAIRRMLPPLTGQAISLIKDSALVSTIAIYDLTMQGQAIIAETYLVFELWFVIAAIYLVITASLSAGVTVMETYFSKSD